MDRWFQKIAGVGLHRFKSYMNVVTLRGLSSTGCAQRYGLKGVSTHRRVLRATDPESERNGNARGLSPARIDSCSVVAGGVSTTLGCRQTGGRDDVWFTRTLAARGVGDHSAHVSTGIGDGRHRHNGTSVCMVCGDACSTASDIAFRCSRTPGRTRSAGVKPERLGGFK